MARKQVTLTRSDVDAGTPLLQVEDLNTHFLTEGGTVRAVDGVSFTLERGKTLGIVGESGSGKTILSRSIMGLLPTHNVVRTGSASYEGAEIAGQSHAAMRSLWGTEMAMVFQDPMTSLNPVMKVGNQITESLRYHLDMEKGEARETAIALLRSVGIPEPAQRVNEYPHQLSGGMRQRVMIAIALACGPRLLFADEPTTALDVTVQAQILDLLQAQQTERHMAIILITHDLGVVAGRADEIAVMYAGKIVEKAPTSVLFSTTRNAVHRGPAEVDPQAGEHQPHPPRGHHRTSAGPRVAPGRLQLRPRCPYAQPKCFVEEPVLEVGPAGGHEFACWYPVGTPEGAEALARNAADAEAGVSGGVA